MERRALSSALLAFGCTGPAPAIGGTDLNDEAASTAKADNIARSERPTTTAGCRPIWYAANGPLLDGGPTWDRVNDHLEWTDRPGPLLRKVSYAVPPVRIGGLDFVVAHHYGVDCGEGQHRACYVGSEGVYCSGIESDFAELVVRTRLDSDPHRITDDEWLGLVAMFSNGALRIDEPEDAALCFGPVRPEFASLVGASVTHTPSRVRAALTTVDSEGALWHNEVTVGADEVSSRRRFLGRKVVGQPQPLCGSGCRWSIEAASRLARPHGYRTSVPPAPQSGFDNHALEQGAPAASWSELEWLDGRHRRLTDFADHVVLLHFFEPDSSAALATSESLQHLQETYHARGLRVVAIAVSADMMSPTELRESTERFVAEQGWTFPVAIDPKSRLLDRYAPVDRRWYDSPTFVIRDGRVVEHIHGGPEFHPGGPPDHHHCRSDYLRIAKTIERMIEVRDWVKHRDGSSP